MMLSLQHNIDGNDCGLMCNLNFCVYVMENGFFKGRVKRALSVDDGLCS